MLGLFWDLAQQHEIGAATERARSAGDAAQQASREISILETQVDKLTLTCAALWTLLKRQGFTDADLEEAIREADLSDGRLDGQIRTSPTECGSCGRTISRRHGRCLFCGA